MNNIKEEQCNCSEKPCVLICQIDNVVNTIVKLELEKSELEIEIQSQKKTITKLLSDTKNVSDYIKKLENELNNNSEKSESQTPKKKWGWF